MPAKRCERMKFKSSFYVIPANGICIVFRLWRPALLRTVMKITTWGGKDKQDGEDDEGEKEEEMGMERGRRSRISTWTPEEGEQGGWGDRIL